MKILILSCNTGEGHNSSGKALKNALTRRGVECDIEDTLAFRSERLSKAISYLYDLSIRTSLFGMTYRFAEWYCTLQLRSKSPVYAFNWLYARKLAQHIEEGGYDGVICVHLFPAEAITRIRRKYGLCVPTIFVMTDYTCIPFLYETELDRYIIAHDSLTDEFVDKGLDRDKLQAVGIPVNEDSFSRKVQKGAARKEVESAFGWEASGGNWYLIMGGSMGFGNQNRLIGELNARICRDDRVICICGRNGKLKESIEYKFRECPCVKALGYTDKVAQLMDASDVLLTKPGGITSTEALIKNIPLVHIDPIKGLEEDNAAFFRNLGLALGSDTVEGQAEQAVMLCRNREARERMARTQRLNSNRRCSNEIADIFIRMARQ